MSRLKPRPRADHRHAAEMARQMPGRWVLAGSYNGTQSAQGAAHMVRTGGDSLPHYRPAGAFQTCVELTDDGADLWVRYVAPESSRSGA